MQKTRREKLNLLASLRYYVWASYRRKLLDKLLERHRKTFSGVVLDIGGRSRGCFEKPKDSVDKWIFADINPEYKPDIVLDVANMTQIEDSSIDVICACELFEHVAEIERGLDECVRVLKENGTMIVSVPFLYAIHADPSDYQRWTQFKWRKEIEQRSCHVDTFVIMGRFFTVMSDHTKTFFKS
ncbi:MAG: class I SAM-dependent methyltransferase, partial [Candidatus Uhrbacteria bacterium]|nr:class I SAM-dependent methyltransferase [Candidatus Uhrbacteria bacterium]